MPTQHEKVRRFRALHDAPETFVIPNPWDAGTARVLAGLGYPALATTSAGLAHSLGRRDGARLVTRDEALSHARVIVEATDLPVSADLENCFGDEPEFVADTVRRAAGVGLAGCSVEDATGDPDHPIYELRLATERVAAAVAAARSLPFPFVLVARAENFLHGRQDLPDTLRRLEAYAAAGADVLYAPGVKDLDAVRSVCSAVAPKPVNALANPAWSVAELAAAGVRRISLGSALSRSAFGAFLRAAREIQAQGTFTFAREAASFAEIESFMAGEVVSS
jgi:2-methylisocitrate lyase-like PEP mutase family enzyme